MFQFSVALPQATLKHNGLERQCHTPGDSADTASAELAWSPSCLGPGCGCKKSDNPHGLTFIFRTYLLAKVGWASTQSKESAVKGSAPTGQKQKTQDVTSPHAVAQTKPRR